MVEGVVTEPTKIGVKLRAENCDIAYPPIFQVRSGSAVAALSAGAVAGFRFNPAARQPGSRPWLLCLCFKDTQFATLHSPAAALT